MSEHQVQPGITFHWHVAEYDDAAVAVVDDRGRDIAHMVEYERGEGPTEAEQRRHAALLAAAPALKNALQLALLTMPEGADRDEAVSALRLAGFGPLAPTADPAQILLPLVASNAPPPMTPEAIEADFRRRLAQAEADGYVLPGDAAIRLQVAPRGDDTFEAELAGFLAENEGCEDLAEWARKAQPGAVERFFGWVGHYFDVTVLGGGR